MKNLRPVSVAGIEFDAIIDSTEGHTASVPEYPVDNGYSVSDNLALSPMELSMTLYVTATPVTWLARHGSGEDRIRIICDELMNLFESRELFEVITPDRIYSNMVISDLEIKRSQDIGYAIEIPITMKQVTVTISAVTMIPASYARSGATGASTGNASSQEVSPAVAYFEGKADEIDNETSSGGSGKPKQPKQGKSSPAVAVDVLDLAIQTIKDIGSDIMPRSVTVCNTIESISSGGG